jgi:hypothetical protein
MHPADRFEGVAAGEGEAELLVLVGGRDELVRVRLDSNGGAHEHVLLDPTVGTELREPVDLDEGVDHDPTDAGVQGRGQLGDRLVVAVQQDPVPREACAQRDRQLAAGADVEAESFLLDPPGHGRAEERLRRIEHLSPAERVAVVAAALPQVGLVQEERRRPVRGREGADVVAAQREMPCGGALGAQRPDRRVQEVEVGRGPAVQALVGELARPWSGGVDAHEPVTSARGRSRRAGAARSPGRAGSLRPARAWPGAGR